MRLFLLDTTEEALEGLRQNVLVDLRRYRSWHVAEGLFFVLAGLAAIALPVTTGRMFGTLFGALLAVAGAARLLGGLKLLRGPGAIGKRGPGAIGKRGPGAIGKRGPGAIRKFGRRWRLGSGLVFLSCGALMLLRPMAGVDLLGLVFGLLLLAEGIADTLLAVAYRPVFYWNSMLLSGAVNLLLGLLILCNLPLSGALMLAVALGFGMVFYGLSLLMLALSP